jgi:methylmalonyl-CoA mutase cobalamin-binding subunit
MIVAPTTDAAKALRRAAGPEAQVVAMPVSGDEALQTLASSRADVVVVSSELDGARDLISKIGADSAVVWVGPDAPDGAHASIDEVSDALEGAITRGLLAARATRK